MVFAGRQHATIPSLLEGSPGQNPPRAVLVVGQVTVVVLQVQGQCRGPLPQIRAARNGPGLLPHLPEHRQQNRHQQRYHRDHHEQLDQRKRPFFSA